MKYRFFFPFQIHNGNLTFASISSKDGAEIPRATKQRHMQGGKGRRYRPHHRRRILRRPVAGLHPDSNNVPRLHLKPWIPSSAADPGIMERLCLHHGRRGRVRGPERGGGGEPPRAGAERRRRWGRGVEQSGQATEVRAHRRAAAEGAGGAVRPVRDEHASTDPAGDRGLQLLQERVREGEALGLAAVKREGPNKSITGPNLTVISI